MHASCNSSSNHFCQNGAENNDEKSDSNNSLFNNTVNSSQDHISSQKASVENLDYWHYLSNNLHQQSNDTLTDNLVYDDLPVFHNVPKSADYHQVAKRNHPSKQRNSFDATTSTTKFSFNFTNEQSSRSTPTTPFKTAIRHDKNNNITTLNEEDGFSSKLINQMKTPGLSSNTKLTSCIKNWFYSKTGRRNSKDSLTMANLADKPVRSKYSLTIDDKITKKQLENLIKKNKKSK